MNPTRRTPVVAALAALVVLPACSPSEGPDADGLEEAVYTTFHPTTWMAERISGGAVPVVCPVPDDVDPIFWQPPRDVLARYQKARLIVLNGADFEKWVATASLPESRVVSSAAGFSDRFIRSEGVTHSHGPAGEHRHEGIDGHTWLDPVLAKAQARAVADGMSAAFPAHAGAFARNLAALEADLDRLHGRLEAIAPRVQEAYVLCSHPAYDYVARRYGWTVRNLDLDPASPLPEGVLDALAPPPDAGPRRVMLWESEPLPATASALRDEHGIESVLFSPCELLDDEDREAGRDYLGVMHANVDRLDAALR